MHEVPTLSNNKGFSTAKLLVAVLALLIIAGAAYGIYLWQQRQTTNLNQQVSDLKNQIQQLEATKNTSSQNSVQPVNTYTSLKGVKLRVFSPDKSATVSSPLVVMGEVPGNWSFEASFPVKLLDSNGKVVAEKPAELLDDWMTENMVAFTVKLSFDKNAVKSGEAGKLVLQKDNPSGLEDKNDSVTIDVKF